MKQKLRSSIILLFVFLLNSNSIFSLGFNSVHTPDGVNIIAVGNSGLIYRSHNGGNSWSSYTISSANFNSVYSLNNNVWISGNDGRIYKTQKTNSAINSYGIGITNSILSVYFVDDNNGFLCGEGGIVYKTINGGINWSASGTGITSVKLNSISFSDNQKGITVGDNGAVYVTSNGGATWSMESIGTTKKLLKAKYFPDGIAVVGEYGTLYLKQVGGNWTSVNTRIVTDITGVTGSGINDIHVCGGGGFIRNNKNGDARFYTFEANPMIANLVDIFYYDSNLAFAISSFNTAIIRTTNGGSTWALTAGTTMSYQWQSKLTSSGGIGNNLCQHPIDRNSMYVAYGSRIFVSRNRGDNWTQIATMTGPGITNGRAHSFYVSPIDTNIWLAAIANVSPDKVIRSTDYGVTWTSVLEKNFTNYGQPLEMDQNNPNVFFFAPDNGGFWKSTNNGETFTEISNYPFRSPCDIIITWDSSNVIFLGDGVTGSGQAQIFKSANGGVNWTSVITLSTSSETPSMCNSVFEQNEVYSTEWPGPNFYETEDFGKTWRINYTTGFSGWASGIAFEDPNVIVIGNYGPQSAFTFNDGFTYTHIGSLAGSGAGILVPEKNYVLNMQTSTLYKLNVTYSVLTSVNENIISVNVPEKFNLYQNYPNPFNPVTNIKFDLPNPGNISLKVYDQIGREVKIIVEGFRNAGSYELNFEADELSSGIYFYKLISDDAAITKKMLLVK